MQTAALNGLSVAKRGRASLQDALIFATFVSSFFQPKERRTSGINVRITPALERDLKTLARLWSVASQAHSGDNEIEVSENDAAFRCLSASVGAAITEMLGDAKTPETEAEWKAVEAAIRKRFSPK